MARSASTYGRRVKNESGGFNGFGGYYKKLFGGNSGTTVGWA